MQSSHHCLGVGGIWRAFQARQLLHPSQMWLSDQRAARRSLALLAAASRVGQALPKDAVQQSGIAVVFDA